MGYSQALLKIEDWQQFGRRAEESDCDACRQDSHRAKVHVRDDHAEEGALGGSLGNHASVDDAGDDALEIDGDGRCVSNDVMLFPAARASV